MKLTHHRKPLNAYVMYTRGNSKSSSGKRSSWAQGHLRITSYRESERSLDRSSQSNSLWQSDCPASKYWREKLGRRIRQDKGNGTVKLMIRRFTSHSTHRDWKCKPPKQTQDKRRFFARPPNKLCEFFVLRKKGSKTKERMKEEEIEKGDCGPPTRKVFFFFFWFCRTWTKRYLITSQTRVKRVSRIHHRTILRGWSGGVSG